MSDRSSTRRRYLWSKGWRRCIWCGGRLNARSLTAEHLTPRSAGGTDQRANLAAACATCNHTRGSAAWVPHPEVVAWAVRRGLLPRAVLAETGS